MHVIEEKNNKSISPIKIERIKNLNSKDGIGIEITWEEGKRTFISSSTLRTNCLCASCLEEKKKKRVKNNPFNIIKEEASANSRLNLIEVLPVGNYAINIVWEDGHRDGIYTFKTLFNLSNI